MSDLSILIIDDNENLVDGVESMLDIHFDDAEIYTAYNGMDGLRNALTHKPQLIFLDLNLPDISGQQVLAEIRKRQLPSKVIMLTGDDSISEISGADGYLKKPVMPKQLIAKIESLI